MSDDWNVAKEEIRKLEREVKESTANLNSIVKILTYFEVTIRLVVDNRFFVLL